MKPEKISEQMNKIIFMGTPAFAVPTLDLLCKHNKKPILCISQPDKIKGRNRKIRFSEVKQYAVQAEIPVFQPEDINAEESVQVIKKYEPDIIITVAYGGLLKKAIRSIPTFGCINLHPSLLPKYRGSAPINFVLFQGDTITGCTVFRLTAKMDAGPILYQSTTKIIENECYTELADRLALQGAEDVVKTLELLDKNKCEPRKQDHSQATYSRKLAKEDFLMNWDSEAYTIQNRVRGLAVKPGLTASFRGKRIKIIKIERTDEKSSNVSGTVINVLKNKGIMVATNDFDVIITQVQPMGKTIMNAYAFHLGARIQPGEKFTDGF